MQVTGLNIAISAKDSRNYLSRAADLSITIAIDEGDDVEAILGQWVRHLKDEVESNLYVGRNPDISVRTKVLPTVTELTAEVAAVVPPPVEEAPIQPPPPPPPVRMVSPEPAPEEPRKAEVEKPPAPTPDVDLCCTNPECRRQVAMEAARTLSVRKYGKILCPGCQKAATPLEQQADQRKPRHGGVTEALPTPPAPAASQNGHKTPEKGARTCEWCNGTGIDKHTNVFCTCPAGIDAEQASLTAGSTRKGTGNRPVPLTN